MINPWQRLPPRSKRVSKIAGITVASLLTLDILVVVGFGFLHPAVPARVDAVIVLGAKVDTPALTHRALTGLAYYQAGRADTLILSGARGPDEPVSEAQAMETVIKNEITRTHGVMPKLQLETNSADTFQNINNSKKLIPRAKSVLIISDRYHLARSAAIAKHAGFKTVYWDSPTPSYYSVIDLVHYYVREAIALIVYLPKLI